MNNILSAIISIVNDTEQKVVCHSPDRVQNRANQMGDALEDYIKDAFAGCIGKNDEEVTEQRSLTFSYLGNKNNPPDAMLRGGDAIEIKKITSITTSQLQLNSSYPKNKLSLNNSKICTACKKCEDWDEKDMIYAVGQVDKSNLRNLFFIYGDIYCDAPEVYERVESTIKDGLEEIENVNLVDTNELGRINCVDHLGISDLRVRGMWLIKSPFLQFSNIVDSIQQSEFRLIAIIPEIKYCNFPNKQEFEDFCSQHSVIISNKRIPNPQNPAQLINSKIITYYK